MRSIKDYHKTISEELISIKNRVRNLIGNSNWGPEGTYKEAILKNVISRFLPKKFFIGTGFVVKKQDYSSDLKSTTQIDLIICDSSYPVIFTEGDFIITGPEAVKGIIEVKTKIDNHSILRNVVKKANKIGKFIYKGKELQGNPIFNGIFAYEFEPNIIDCPESFKNSLKITRNQNIPQNSEFYIVNHLSLNKDLFIKYWKAANLFRLYEIEDFSFSFFISNLVYYVTEKNLVRESPIWFPEDKELNKICEF